MLTPSNASCQLKVYTVKFYRMQKEKEPSAVFSLKPTPLVNFCHSPSVHMILSINLEYFVVLVAIQSKRCLEVPEARYRTQGL